MGPLEGYKIVELFCIGPGPFAGMLLSDMGADVVRIDRPIEGEYGYPPHEYRTLWRNRRSVAVDLANPAGLETVMRLVEQADALIEGNRPGVTERLGIGPDECLARNPRLVYGRMTGFGQDGPLAQEAGFDLSFISLSGVAHAVGPADRPTPPLILTGDFGGGGTFLAMGMLAALLEVQRSGQGQVVDAAMVDGSANLMAYMYGGLAGGVWHDEREANAVDGGSWLYRSYECADGRFVSVAALLERFHSNLIPVLGLDPDEYPFRVPRTEWPRLRAEVAAIFRTRTRDAWVEAFAGTDACVQPVLTMTEAPDHPHNIARGTFVEHGGVMQPAPAPRFSRTPSEISRPPARHAEHTDEVLTDWGFSAGEIEALRGQASIV